MIPNFNLCGKGLTIALCLLFSPRIVTSCTGIDSPGCVLVQTVRMNKSSLDAELESWISPPFVYYMTNDDWNPEDRTLKIFCLNINSQLIDSAILKIPEEVIIHAIPGIAMNGNYLILTDDDRFKMFLFIRSGNSFIFRNKINLPSDFVTRRLKFLTADRILLYSIYNFHPVEGVQNTNLSVYDIQNDSIIKILHPELPCIGFSHLINEWISVSDDRIAIADPCGYTIRFYNFDLDLQDSIIFHPGGRWKDLPGNTLPFSTSPAEINPKLLIDKLLKIQDTISRIEKLFFLNDQSLLVISTCGAMGKRRMDIWDLTDLRKPIAMYDDVVTDSDSVDTIDINLLPPDMNRPLRVYVKNQIVYRIYDEDFYVNNSMSINEYKRQKNIYYENFDPKFSISIARLVFP